MSDSPPGAGGLDDLLERYLVGDLPAAAVARVEEKLGKDPALRARLAELRALRMEFLMADPPAQFAHRVVAKVELERRLQERPERDWGRWLLPLRSAAVLGAVVVVAMTVSSDHAAFNGLREALEPVRFGAAPEVDSARDMVRDEEAGAVAVEKESSRRRVKERGAPVPGPSKKPPVEGDLALSQPVKAEPGHPSPVQRGAGSTPESFLRLKTSPRRSLGEAEPMRVLSAPMRQLLAPPSEARPDPQGAGAGGVAEAFFRPVQKRAPSGGVAVWVVLPQPAYLMVVRVAGTRVIGSAPRESVAGRAGSNSIPIPAELASGSTAGGALFLVTGARAFSVEEVTLTPKGPGLGQGWLRTERVVGAGNGDSPGQDKEPLK